MNNACISAGNKLPKAGKRLKLSCFNILKTSDILRFMNILLSGNKSLILHPVRKYFGKGKPLSSIETLKVCPIAGERVRRRNLFSSASLLAEFDLEY